MYLESEKQFWMGPTRLPEKRRPRVAPARDPGPPQGGIFQDKLTDSPERVALWQAPVPRRWPGPGCNAQPPTARRGIVFLVKPRKFNSGRRECRPLKSFLKTSVPFILLVYVLADLCFQ